MSTINLPPFYVGQRVVCVEGIGNAHGQRYETGKEYIVDYVVKCSKCGLWHIGTIDMPGLGIISECVKCPAIIDNKKNKYGLVRASRFAPINENFQSITLEKVLEEETKLISVN